MWRTQLGDRTLKGAEWEVFRAGLDMAWDQLQASIEFDDPDSFETEVAGFDRLEPNQKLAMLALVANALLSEEVPAPALTAVAEATVAAVFGLIRLHTVMELEMAGESTEGDDTDDASSVYYWRKLLRAAYPEVEALQDASLEAMIAEHPSPGEFVKPAWLDGIEDEEEEKDEMDEADPEPSFQLPDVTSKDVIDWEVVIDALTDAVLWGDRDFEMDAEFLDAPPATKKALAREMGIDAKYFLAIAPDPTERELEEIRAVLGKILGRKGPQSLS